MAITQNSLTSHTDATDATSYVTASSYTPAANRLVIAAVLNSKGASADTPTGAGNGLTWVQIATLPFSSNRRRLTIFRAMGASPTNGAFTADFAGATQTGCAISITEFAGVDTSGTNGSGAVVQNATNTGTAVSSLTVTLAAFGSANNGAYAAFGAVATVAITHDSGWSEIHDISFTPPSGALETQWIATNDTSAVGTMSSGTADMGGIAIEIKAAAVAGENPWYAYAQQ